ncbi:MAG: hypothetical protein ACTS6A_00750 [Candidatus Hodgkinia cicadicola]
MVIGCGIRRLKDVEVSLNSGADKVVINSMPHWIPNSCLIVLTNLVLIVL